jgi:hypothetical protein
LLGGNVLVVAFQSEVLGDGAKDFLNEETTAKLKLQSGLGGGVNHLLADFSLVGDIGHQDPLITELAIRVQTVNDEAGLGLLEERADAAEVW